MCAFLCGLLLLGGEGPGGILKQHPRDLRRRGAPFGRDARDHRASLSRRQMQSDSPNGVYATRLRRLSRSLARGL